MRMMNRNKRTLYYALLNREVPIYETDDDGNIRYDSFIQSDGTEYTYAVETGETELGYSEPVKMLANISFESNETTAQEFGVDVSDYDAIVVFSKSEYPITETSRIWFESTPRYKDAAETIIDGDSADYQVVSVRNTLNEGKAILRHLTK